MQRIDNGVARECAPAGQHLVEDRAEREEVGACAGRLSAYLFRRHVPGRAHDQIAIGVGGRGLSVRVGLHRQAEVQDLDRPVYGDEQVPRFQIAVDDAPFVRGRQAQQHLPRHPGGLVHRERAALQPGAKRFSGEQLRDHVGDVAIDAHVVHREDVGMVERGDGLRLSPEPGQLLGGDLVGTRDHLDADVAVELGIAGPVDLAHSPRVEERQDGVAAQAGAGFQ